MQQPNAAAGMNLFSVLKAVAITAKRESPAPETSTGFTDKAGKLCLLIFLEDVFLIY